MDRFNVETLTTLLYQDRILSPTQRLGDLTEDDEIVISAVMLVKANPPPPPPCAEDLELVTRPVLLSEPCAVRVVVGLIIAYPYKAPAREQGLILKVVFPSFHPGFVANLRRKCVEQGVPGANDAVLVHVQIWQAGARAVTRTRVLTPSDSLRDCGGGNMEPVQIILASPTCSRCVCQVRGCEAEHPDFGKSCRVCGKVHQWKSLPRTAWSTDHSHQRCSQCNHLVLRTDVQ